MTQEIKHKHTMEMLEAFKQTTGRDFSDVEKEIIISKEKKEKEESISAEEGNKYLQELAEKNDEEENGVKITFPKEKIKLEKHKPSFNVEDVPF